MAAFFYVHHRGTEDTEISDPQMNANARKSVLMDFNLQLTDCFNKPQTMAQV